MSSGASSSWTTTAASSLVPSTLRSTTCSSKRLLVSTFKFTLFANFVAYDLGVKWRMVSAFAPYCFCLIGDPQPAGLPAAHGCDVQVHGGRQPRGLRSWGQAAHWFRRSRSVVSVLFAVHDQSVKRLMFSTYKFEVFVNLVAYDLAFKRRIVSAFEFYCFRQLCVPTFEFCCARYNGIHVAHGVNVRVSMCSVKPRGS